jgi:hypothetical protein
MQSLSPDQCAKYGSHGDERMRRDTAGTPGNVTVGAHKYRAISCETVQFHPVALFGLEMPTWPDGKTRIRYAQLVRCLLAGRAPAFVSSDAQALLLHILLGFVDGRRGSGGIWSLGVRRRSVDRDWIGRHWRPGRPADDRARRLGLFGVARHGHHNGEARNSPAPCGQTPC